MILEKLRSIIEAQGLKDYGFASLRKPLSLDYYRQWLMDGLHGEMGYLERHLKVKESPELKYPRAYSAIVFRFPYYPVENNDFPLKETRVALYAQSQDYHDALKEKLEPLLGALKEAFPDEEFQFHTDSGPVLERDLAYQAGLGWFGKNTCIINQKQGSLFFIAEVLTSLKLESAKNLHPDRCGKCTRCIDICPTQALSAETKSLDASKCISYLNIEKKSLPSPELREKMQDWFFGCDLCQTVCPWNEKFHGKDEMQNLVKPKSSRITLISELRHILNSSDDELKDFFSGTPLLRAKPKGLRRNAILVATNQKLVELKPEITSFTKCSFLGELAAWSLERL